MTFKLIKEIDAGSIMFFIRHCTKNPHWQLTIISLQFTHKNFKIPYLISLRSRYLMLLPSTLMSPWWISVILNRAWNRLDLPDPVLPTMPTFSVGLVQKVTPFRASDRSLLYRKRTFLKETTPIVGQNGETWNDWKQMNLLYPLLIKLLENVKIKYHM